MKLAAKPNKQIKKISTSLISKVSGSAMCHAFSLLLPLFSTPQMLKRCGLPQGEEGALAGSSWIQNLFKPMNWNSTLHILMNITSPGEASWGESWWLPAAMMVSPSSPWAPSHKQPGLIWGCPIHMAAVQDRFPNLPQPWQLTKQLPKGDTQEKKVKVSCL